MDKMKLILITGGAGFIGTHLALALKFQGRLVRVLDNFSSQIHGSNKEDSYLYQSIKNKVEVIEGDICDKKIWPNALDGVDVIIHLAAETGTAQSMYEIGRYVKTNVHGTAMMLDALAAFGKVRKLIVASSRAVYGEGKYMCSSCGIVNPRSRDYNDLRNGLFEIKCPVCNRMAQSLATDEKAVLNPISIYGRSKKFQEELILANGILPKVNKIVLRLQNVFGPGQSLLNPYTGILSIFSNRIRNGQGISIFEDGKESRDFVFISDIVRAICLSIECDVRDRIYNVGTGTPRSVLDIAQKLVKLLKSSVPVTVTGEFRVGDIRHNFADITAISKELAFIPETSLEEGLSLFAKWVEQEPIANDTLEKALQELRQKRLLS
jgi:dTDP-L-rhamnose 4-epimerase